MAAQKDWVAARLDLAEPWNSAELSGPAGLFDLTGSSDLVAPRTRRQGLAGTRRPPSWRGGRRGP
jgi:hypothetical protein